MKKKDVTLFVATPMYGGLCTGMYTSGIMQLVGACGQNGMKMYFSFMMNESLITRARNSMAFDFLKSDATHMMFIDADISFNPNDVVRMVQADKDIICGIYPKKEINWQTVRNAINAGVPDDQLKHHTGAFVVNLVDYQTEVTVPINQPVEIWNGGTGFMLIQRHVLETMVVAHPEWFYEFKGEDICGVFDFQNRDGVYLGEDYLFCDRAREHGYKIYIDVDISLPHVGTDTFEYNFREEVVIPLLDAVRKSKLKVANG